mgnify:CR=1 FL=1
MDAGDLARGLPLKLRAARFWRSGIDLAFALFRALHYRHQAAISVRVGAAIILIEALQLLAFALHGEVVQLPWHHAYVGWLSTITKITRPDLYAAAQGSYRQVPPAAVFAAVACCWIWLMLFIAAAYLLHRARSSSDATSSSASSSAALMLSSDGAQDLDSDSTGTEAYQTATTATSAVDGLIATSWVFATLRCISNVAVTICFIPLLGLLLLPLRCEMSFLGRSDLYQCGSPLHLAMQATGLVSAALFVFLAALYVLLDNTAVTTQDVQHDEGEEDLFGERSEGYSAVKENASRGSPGVSAPGQATAAFARSHSRVELVYLTLRGLLIIVYSVITHDNPTTRWALCGLYGGITVCLAGLYTYYLPYLQRRVLQTRIAAFWLCAWGGVALVITLLYDSVDEPAGGILLLFGAPMAVAIAVFTTAWRKSQVENMNIDAVLASKDVLLIELKARLLMTQGPRSYDDGEAGKLIPAVDTQEPVVNLKRQSATSVISSSDDGLSVSLPFGVTRRKVAGSTAGASLGLKGRSSGWDQAEFLLQSACLQLPSSALACVQLAQFQLQQRGNHLRAGRLLIQAKQRSPPLDVRFLMSALQSVIKRQLLQSHVKISHLKGASKSMRHLNGRGAYVEEDAANMLPATLSSSDVAGYLHYQQHVTKANAHVQAATRLQHRFWTELLLPEPNVQSLTATGTVRVLMSMLLHIIYLVAMDQGTQELTSN